MIKRNYKGIIITGLILASMLFVTNTVSNAAGGDDNDQDTVESVGELIGKDNPFKVVDPSKIDKLTQEIYQTAGYQYNTMSIKERFPQIFHWLDLQDMNVFIILGLIILVSGVSMISILLIIILDNATTIGVLKSLGATNKSVKSIFIRVALPIIFYGLILGNGIGLGLGMLQYHFGIIKLPVESYYVAQVPIHFSFSMLIFLNLGTIFCCFLMLIWPSSVIARIRPARVLKFD